MNDFDGDKSSETDADYTKWSIVTDPTFTEDGLAYGIEMVSPIFVSDFGDKVHKSTGTWQPDVDMI